MSWTNVEKKDQALAVIAFLKTELANRRHKNRSYSLRSFARSLGIESATLSKIMNGTRPLTFATAQKILSALNLDESQKNSLLLSIGRPQNYVLPTSQLIELSEQQLKAICGWQFYAILCVLEYPEQRFSTAQIAKLLGCPIALVKSSLDVMLKLNFITEENSRYTPISGRLTTSHKLPSPSLIKAHHEYLDKAIEALLSDRHRERSDFSGMTMAVSKKKLPEAIRRIREFRRGLAAYLGDGHKDDVYRINIQLFPLTEE